MGEKNITISLSASQRNLLLEHEQDFVDADLFRLFAVAVKKGGKFEITLTEAQLVDVCDLMAFCANAEEDPKRQSRLDDLCDHLEGYLDLLDSIQSCSTCTGSVYVFKVSLLENAKIWRRIAIRGGQTLHDLHQAIFKAFDRYDEHLYSFCLPRAPVKNPPHRLYEQSTEYMHPYAIEGGDFDGDEKYDAAMTTIESLDLSAGQVLYYLFDFGDSWWHQIVVEKTDGVADKGKYPRILERHGKSPDQYGYQ